MEEMNAHERWSELLAPYVTGELPEDEAARVAEHLDGCSECSAEHRAVVALQGPRPEPLNDMERARLRRAVLEEAVPAPETAAAVPDAQDRRAGLFPLLGAAAIALVIAVFAYGGVGGLGGGDAGSSADAPAQLEAEGGDGSSESQAGSEEALSQEATQDTAGGAPGAARAAAPEPTFRSSIGDVDSARLNRFGRRGLSLVVFSRAFTASDVPRLRDDFVDVLARKAPAARARQIRECTAEITANFPNTLPAYSAIGNFTEGPQREVLIVAFAWTDQEEGPLDQSMVWAWPLGTCDSVAHYSKNLIEPRS